jgi:glyoxylase-like metal-dependent hydrolase (beta-lactamase superfamily II)
MLSYHFNIHRKSLDRQEPNVEIATFLTTPLQENCYVMTDGDEALVIDPGDATPELLQALEGFTVKTIVNTHAHFDHVGGNAKLIEHMGCKLAAHKDCEDLLGNEKEHGQKYGMEVDNSPKPDIYLDQGDTLQAVDQFKKAMELGDNPFTKEKLSQLEQE